MEEGKYRVVVVNPELLGRAGGPFEKMWAKPAFLKRIQYFVFDEGHCISEWGSFRPDYPELNLLRHLIPSTIPFYVASATLPTPILRDVKKTLQLRDDKTVLIRRSNNRPDLHLVVRTMQGPANKFYDLDFLLPNPEEKPPPFAVFFDSIQECEQAAQHLREKLPPDARHKIVWFHSHMSPEFREETLDAFRKGEIWGLCVTDSFGMVRVSIFFPPPTSTGVGPCWAARAIPLGLRRTSFFSICV